MRSDGRPDRTAARQQAGMERLELTLPPRPQRPQSASPGALLQRDSRLHGCPMSAQSVRRIVSRSKVHESDSLVGLALAGPNVHFHDAVPAVAAEAGARKSEAMYWLAESNELQASRQTTSPTQLGSLQPHLSTLASTWCSGPSAAEAGRPLTKSRSLAKGSWPADTHSGRTRYAGQHIRLYSQTGAPASVQRTDQRMQGRHLRIPRTRLQT